MPTIFRTRISTPVVVTTLGVFLAGVAVAVTTWIYGGAGPIVGEEFAACLVTAPPVGNPKCRETNCTPPERFSYGERIPFGALDKSWCCPNPTEPRSRDAQGRVLDPPHCFVPPGWNKNK